MKKSRILAVTIAVIGGAYFAWTGWSRPAKEVAEAALLRDPSGFSPNYAYDGIILASAPMESNEQAGILSSLLGVHMQKFSAKTTKPLSRVTFHLELREPGKPIKVLASPAFSPFGGDRKPGLSAVYVAIQPVNGSLSQADRIKFAIYSGGVFGISDCENPFKGANSYGSPNGEPGRKDIPLLGANFPSDGKGTRARYRTLVLRLETDTTL